MGTGIMDLIGLAAALAFAIPVALFGLGRLAGGEVLMGGALLGVAVLMVVVEEYVLTPSDLPKVIASKAVRRAVDRSDDEE
jgi:hypothetical protein